MVTIIAKKYETVLDILTKYIAGTLEVEIDNGMIHVPHEPDTHLTIPYRILRKSVVIYPIKQRNLQMKCMFEWHHKRPVYNNFILYYDVDNVFPCSDRALDALRFIDHIDIILKYYTSCKLNMSYEILDVVNNIDNNYYYHARLDKSMTTMPNPVIFYMRRDALLHNFIYYFLTEQYIIGHAIVGAVYYNAVDNVHIFGRKFYISQFPLSPDAMNLPCFKGRERLRISRTMNKIDNDQVIKSLTSKKIKHLKYFISEAPSAIAESPVLREILAIHAPDMLTSFNCALNN